MSYTPSVTATERYATVDVVGQRFTYPVSTATIADVAAPIKGNNLLKASNNIADSSWTKTRASAGATVDVTLDDGTEVTLTKLVEDGTAANTHLVRAINVPVACDKPHVFRALIKSAGNSRRLRLIMDAGSSVYVFAHYDPDTATVVTTSAAGGASLISATITLVGTADSVYLCELIGTPGLAGDIEMGMAALALVSGTNDSYNGDSTSGVYIGQKQLTEGTEATTYNETTTERISGDGQRLTHSGDLANAGWTKTNVTGVSAGSIAYTNAATLDTGEVLSMAGVYETVTNATHVVVQSSDVNANVSAVGMVKVKGGLSRDYVQIRMLNASATSDYAYANFRFSTGAFSTGATLAGTAVSATVGVESLGDGAYELRMTAVCSTAAGVARFQVMILNDSAVDSYAGEVTKGAYVTEPILVAGSTAPSYTRSYADRLAAGGSTRDRAYVLIPHIDEFDAAGDHIGTRWNTEQTWAVTDGTNTASATEQFAPPDAAAFGSAGVGPYTYPPDGVTPGDDAYIHILTGSGAVDPVSFGYSPSTSSTFRSMGYSVVDGEWLPNSEASASPTIDAAVAGGRVPKRFGFMHRVR